MVCKIVPVFNDKLSEMGSTEINSEVYECFEKLYRIYDDKFKINKDLYATA
jgi:hypothetical protein